LIRQKKPLDRVVEKYTTFLTILKELSYETEEDNYHSFTQLISDYQIDKSVKNALINLKIINIESDKKWHWLSFEIDRKLVVTILNNILEKSKKTPQVNIPLEGFTSALKQQNEILEYLKAIKQDRVLNGARMPLKEINLFEKEDLKETRRFELFKFVLPSLFQGKDEANITFEEIKALNELALEITDNAIQQFHSKQKTNA
jgi:hypothetical protein